MDIVSLAGEDGGGTSTAVCNDITSFRPILYFTERKTFRFTIDGIEYTAKEDMTWSDWIESDYNTAGALISKGNIRMRITSSDRDGIICYSDGLIDVKPSDIINSEKLYEIVTTDE